MRGDKSAHNAGALVLLGLACLAAGAGPILLDHYICVYGEPCGQVSLVCWGPQHPWPQTTCTYCDANDQQDLCQKSYSTTCLATGNTQNCGMKWTGTCQGSGTLGSCVAYNPPLELEEVCKLQIC